MSNGIRRWLAALGVGAVVVVACIVWYGVLSPHHVRWRVIGMRVIDECPNSLASRTFRSPSILVVARGDSRLIEFARKSACMLDFEVVHESGAVERWLGELFCVKSGEEDRVPPLDDLVNDHLFQYWAVVPLSPERMHVWQDVMAGEVREIVISVRCATVVNVARSDVVRFKPKDVRDMIGR